MNYQKALGHTEDIAPQGGAGIFALPVMWLIAAFIILAFAGFASSSIL